MEQQKEHFADTSYDLAKSLYHISIAKQYFEMIQVDKTYNIKALFGQYINKLDYIVNNIYDRLSDDGRKFYSDSVIHGDTVFHSHVSELLLHVPEQQKPLVESIIVALVKGYDVKVSIDNPKDI
jgi:hypothetical protein